MKNKSLFRKLIFSLKNEPVLMIVVIFLVPVLFRLIVDLRVAAVFAGILFLLISILSLRQAYLGKDPWLGGVSVIFLLVFVLPILGLRLLNWEENFRGLSFLGLPSDWLHENSKWVYTAVLMLSVRERYLRIQKKESLNG